MVSALLVLLALSVMQLGLALLIRNTLVDAAAEGARFGSLADNSAADGVARAVDLITTALGPGYATDEIARPDAASEHGFGLWLVRQLSDSVRVTRGPRGGTTVTVELPLK